MSRWKPIETAPKDGTNILVCYDFASVLIAHIAWFRGQDEWEKCGQYVWDGDFSDWNGWWSYIENSVSQHKLEGAHEPTHWMPLPGAPQP